MQCRYLYVLLCIQVIVTIVALVALLGMVLTAIASHRLENASVVTEKAMHLSDSCCDSGALLVQGCQEKHENMKWRDCAQGGTDRLTQWIKCGPNGFPLPTVSAHKGSCAYSPIKRQCPLPVNFFSSAPPSYYPSSKDASVCHDMPPHY
jgi:hypothetical protein